METRGAGPERATPEELAQRLEIWRERYKYELITTDQFQEILRLFQFTDDWGHLWSPGASSNRWYRWDRTQWTPATPPSSLMVPEMPLWLSAAWLGASSPPPRPEPPPQVEPSRPTPAVSKDPWRAETSQQQVRPARPERFQQAEEQFWRLKGQRATGRITPGQFNAALQDLMILDAQGRYWMMGVDTGKWYVYDGQNWVQG